MAKQYKADFVFKVCLLGDGSVGKTSLIDQFTSGKFNQDYIQTLGAQFSSYEAILGDANDVRARLFFWDLAGQEEYRFMRQIFYQGAKAVILVYDLFKPETVETTVSWHEDITKFCGPLPTVVFANKVDLIDEGAYDSSRIEQIVADRSILGWHMTSAKTGKCVQDAFNSIIKILVDKALATGARSN
jgi:small GTP-binding protein